MPASRGDRTGAAPVERFKPTTGIMAGWVGLGLVAFAVGYVALEVHTLTGLRVGIGFGFFGVVVWVTQLRSRAAAYPRSLLLKNTLVDYLVPLTAVDEVSVTRTLNVWVGERRYVCVGIGRPMRSVVRGGRGSGRFGAYAESFSQRGSGPSSMTYEDFVVTRVDELAKQARREDARGAKPAADRPADAEAPKVTRVFAWPEITLLTLTAAAFAVSLLL